MERERYIHLVETAYFGSVSRKDLVAVLGCFTDDARVTIRHGDSEPRRFAVAPRDEDDSPLTSFYEHLCRHYDPTFTEFEHTIDVTACRSACTFLVTLIPSTGSAYAGGGVQRLRNSNFFTFVGERISDMTIYYANTTDVSGEGRAPTGYPPAPDITPGR